jgi:branched-chain amino acid transport system ATP-binding protein
MMPSTPLLEVKNLNVKYGASHVLHDVNFSVAKGQAIALLGRNGMGKTTLIKSLLGQINRHSGDIVWRGGDIIWRGSNNLLKPNAPHIAAQAGAAYVPEGRGIFSSLNVLENLTMTARKGASGVANEWDLDRVLALFPRVKQRLHHAGNQLSGGEQQMVAIGRALMTNPDIIFLDEATEGLAPIIAKDIWATLKQINASGIAVVVVDKNLHAITALAARCVVLEKGRVAFAGESKTLLESRELQGELLGV